MTEREPASRLIELLVVVAIILIIAAIAIPNLLHAKMAANESAAVSSLRAINTASVSYSTTYGNGYAPSLGALGGTDGGIASCDAAEILDSVLSNNGCGNTSKKSGYNFTFTPARSKRPPPRVDRSQGLPRFRSWPCPSRVLHRQRGFYRRPDRADPFQYRWHHSHPSNPAIQ